MNPLIERASAVIFDIGNVLLSFRPEAFLPRLIPQEAARALTPPNLFAGGYWQQLDAATLTEEQVAEGIASTLGDPSLAPHALTVIRRYHTQMELLPAASLIPRLRQAGKRVYILSNYGVDTFARTQERFADLFRQTDGMVISGREKLLKPDPRIYQLLLRRYGLRAQDCVFIDDLPANVAAARALGISGICYTGEADL